MSTTTATGAPVAATPGAAEEPVIRLVEVTVRYPNGKVALDDVNVEIPGGDYVFLVGPSGAGKSTVVRLLIREELPTAGQVYVAGRDLARVRRSQVHRIRRRMGVVFQDFRLLPNKTVYENVAFALEVTGAPTADIRHRVPRLLALVGLEDQARQRPGQLSGGEMQRAAIARAMVHDPPILIADEPTGNLDPVTSWEIVQLLIQINALGTTILMATHNQDIVTAMRRRVVALDNGRLVRDEVGAGYERGYHS